MLKLFERLRDGGRWFKNRCVSFGVGISFGACKTFAFLHCIFSVHFTLLRKTKNHIVLSAAARLKRLNLAGRKNCVRFLLSSFFHWLNPLSALFLALKLLVFFFSENLCLCNTFTLGCAGNIKNNSAWTKTDDFQLDL